MDVVAVFAQRVRTMREKSGLTQDELSFRCSINSGHLSQIERGIYEPRLETVMRIAAGLGTSTAQLLNFDEQLDIPAQDESISKVSSYMLVLPPEDRRIIVAVAKAMVTERNMRRSKKRE